MEAHKSHDQKSCDICKQETSMQAEIRHCAECHQVMCADCVEMHKKFNATKFHKVMSLDLTKTHGGVPITMNEKAEEKDESKVRQSDAQVTVNTSLAQDKALLQCAIHNQQIDFYCKKDQEPVCRTCKLIEHRKCTDFVPLGEAAESESNIINGTLESIQVIENELYKVKKAKIFAKENLMIKKQQVLDQLQQLRQNFDILEANTVNELEHIYDTNATDQDRDTEIIGETRELITQLKKQIEAISEDGTSAERFIASTAAEKELKKYSEVLNDISVITLTDIHFTPHVFWKQIESLGEMGIDKVSQQIGLAKFMSYDVPLKIDSDKEDIFITAMEVFSDGKKLMLDLTNNKIKLFSPDEQFLSEVSFPGEVHDMTLLNDSVAMVTIPSLQEKSLQKVTIIDNVLSLEGSVIVMNTKPGLITKVDDNTLLIISIKDNKIYIMTADQNGHVQNVMNSASGIKRLIKQPVKAEISIDRNTVYILDFYNGCIAVDMSKMKVLHHQEPMYEFYGGMTVDKDGSVYMECGRKENDVKYSNILQLSAEGKIVRKLFPADISPRLIPLKIVSNKMYVFTKNSKKNMVLGGLHHRLL